MSSNNSQKYACDAFGIFAYAGGVVDRAVTACFEVLAKC